MKKQIVSMMMFVICFMFVGTEAMAQGVVVYKKNGEVMKVPYEELDSIVTYNDEGEDIIQTEMVQGHECVDLGLSVKWATCNVGANSPEESGDYYAWGETEIKNDYSWKTYKWCEGTKNSMTKYCLWSINGKVDNKKLLDASDDVAYVKWGNEWRMPTLNEIVELCNECTWTWTIRHDVYGYEVTGSNGNSIFLPAAGKRSGTSYADCGNLTSVGTYWSSDLWNGTCCYAHCIFFYHNDRADDKDESQYRYFGFPVRPVTE